MAYQILIVDPEERQTMQAREILAPAGYSVQLADGFEEALQALAKPYDLLMAAVRLGAYNGLHLVLRSRTLHPQMPALVLGVEGDSATDARRLDVPFLVKPLKRDRLLRAVAEGLKNRPPVALSPQRRWPRKPAHLPATIADNAVRVIDLSYGGLRLEGPLVATGVGSPVAVTFPTLGMSLTAVPRWVKETAAGAAWCGVEILDAPMHVAEQWRGLVDSMH
jgi:CheY-like chemotaxis protein